MVEHQVCCYTVSYDVYETSVRSSPLGYELVHHRVTQSFTELYSFDFKLIKLCGTPLLLCGEILFRQLELATDFHQVDCISDNVLGFLYHCQINHADFDTAGLALNAL